MAPYIMAPYKERRASTCKSRRIWLFAIVFICTVISCGAIVVFVFGKELDAYFSSKSGTSSNSVQTTYSPGDYSLGITLSDKNGRRVVVSNGLDGVAIAYSGDQVQFRDGTRSNIVFHSNPDGAGVFPSETGGFYYTSNAEASNGGVFTIEFDQDGEVIDYYKSLGNTQWNCGGGKTAWNTWITCEENDNSGRVWQVDPSGNKVGEETNLVADGGNYESFVGDYSTPIPTFYITEDSSDGALVQFTPDTAAMECYNSPLDSDKWCTLNSGSHKYLRLSSGGSSGTFTWESNKANANPGRYPYSEGIDVANGKLYFVSKTTQALFILDLAGKTFTKTSTKSGAFNNQPDQIKYITGDVNQIVYFCEDGGSDCGVHGRDGTGKFFSILDGPGYSTETTGLGFSPDSKFMFVSFQSPGVIWKFWRTDGEKFSGPVLDIKYHAV